MSKVAICAIMKYEGPYIVEWAAYYDLMGFRMIVADNGGNDDTTKILSALDAAGIIDRIDFRWCTQSPQFPAYRALVRAAKKLDYDIIGFLDADEFFTRELPITRLAPDVGAAYIRELFEARNANQISFNWTCFGSRSEIEDRSRPVLERFEHHSDHTDQWNLWAKSFVRTDKLMRTRDILGIGPNIDSPHFFPVKRGWYFDDKPAKAYWKAPAVRQTLGRVLHYQNKTWEEYQRKIARGAPSTKAGRNKNNRGYFDAHDYNKARTSVHPDALAALVAHIAVIQGKIAEHEGAGESARFTAAQSRRMARGVSGMYTRRAMSKLRGWVGRLRGR